MTVFVATSASSNESDDLRKNSDLINLAMKRYGKDIDVKTPFYEGRFPAGINHYLYSLGKSIIFMAECDCAVFPEYSGSWIVSALNQIWDETHYEKE